MCMCSSGTDKTIEKISPMGRSKRACRESTDRSAAAERYRCRPCWDKVRGTSHKDTAAQPGRLDDEDAKKGRRRCGESERRMQRIYQVRIEEYVDNTAVLECGSAMWRHQDHETAYTRAGETKRESNAQVGKCSGKQTSKYWQGA